MGETLLRWFDQIHGLKYISLRYFNAAGASLDNALGEDWNVTSNLMPLVMKAAVGKAPSAKIFGTDYPTRDGPESLPGIGGNYFDEHDRLGIEKRLVRRLEKLGYEVSLTATSPAA